MTDPTLNRAAVAQMIAAPWCYASADIPQRLRAVAAERDALALSLTLLGFNPASVIAAMWKDKVDD